MTFTSDFLKNALKKHFGYDSFRNGQEEIIESVLQGNDSLIVMPTGGGKSLCYQLPALLMEGAALIISPLIALMKDQVDALERIGIPATFINSSISFEENQARIKAAWNGKYKLIYIAPERLDSSKFTETLKNFNISFLAVDEAHCISEWGHDFRPSYLTIPKAIENLPHLTIAALTATATPEVQDDIVRSLKMIKANRFIRGFARPNLSYITELCEDKAARIVDICKESASGSTIIYCGSRKRVEMYAGELKKYRLPALAYHAGMPDAIRKNVQEKFINGGGKIIVATNAFGMGIDKPDVRNVIHCDLTQSLEAYYQEAGRAGRDEIDARCVMLYNPNDRRLQEFFIKTTYPPLNDIETIYNALYDIQKISIGSKSYEPVHIDEYRLANYSNLPTNAASSVLSLFERKGIIKRGSSSGSALIEFISEREHLIRYYNNSEGIRKTIFEALLRSVSAEAFSKPVEIDINHFLRKYNIASEEFKSCIMAFEHSRLLKYEPAASSEGIILLLERMPFESLPIDFKAFEERRHRAFAKLDVVQRYAETNECKRNYILQYFGENDISGVCGKCSGCKKVAIKPIRKNSKDKFLQINILSAAARLNGKFGRAALADFVKGSKTSKLLYFGLDKIEGFSSCSDYNKVDIKDNIENAISEGFLSVSPDIYPTISITDKGRKIIDANIKPLKIQPKYNDNKLSDELYNKLKELRDEIARSEGIVPRGIISDITLRKLSRISPTDEQGLKTVPGISEIFIKRYGNKFQKIIKDTIAAEISEEQTCDNVQVTEIEQTIIELVRQRHPLKFIEKKTGMKSADIARIIQLAIEKGIEFDKNLFVHNKVYNVIKDIILRRKHSTLREIRTVLDFDIDYPELRIAVAFARKEIISS